MTGGQVEADGDDSLGLAAPDQAAVGAGAERETERVEQDRLAGSGLAGEDSEAGAEFEIEALDQHDVADGEIGEHGLARMPAAAGFQAFSPLPPAAWTPACAGAPARAAATARRRAQSTWSRDYWRRDLEPPCALHGGGRGRDRMR